MKKELRFCRNGSTPGCGSWSIGFYSNLAEKNQLIMNYEEKYGIEATGGGFFI